MGMFDTLKSKHPLPLPAYQDLEFQTKDMDCEMAHYLIDQEGLLWVAEAEVEDGQGQKGFTRWAAQSRENHRMVPCLDFSGSIDFYTDYGQEEMGGTGWVEFRADVSHGVVVDISILLHTPSAWELAEKNKQEILENLNVSSLKPQNKKMM